MKKRFKIFILIATALFLVGFLKNVIAQNILTGTMSRAAHVPVKAGSVDLSFLSATLRVQNLKVYNPPGFPEKLMLSVPQIFIRFEPGELLHGRAHFKEVKLDLEELIVLRDKNGRLNVDAVKPTEQQKSESKQKTESMSGHEASKLLIDKLSLSIGKVIYKDYSAGAPPAIQTFDINIKNREYTHIDNPSVVVSLLMFEALTRTTLSRLVSLDINSFKEGGVQALSKGLGLVSDGAGAAKNTAKQILNLFH